MFKTEPHLHTAETSSCGKVPAAEMIRMYADAGYATVFVTDHYKSGFFDRREDGRPWPALLDEFLAGYRAAREAGEACGVTVLLSAELRFPDCANDYLVYGLDEALLVAYPRLHKMDAAGFYAFAQAHGLTVIQAHPYRNKCAPDIDCVDGIEVYNANPRHDNQNDLALALAEANPRLLRTSGSDAHRPEDVAGGGVMTASRIASSADYIAALRGGNCSLIRQD